MGIIKDYEVVYKYRHRVRTSRSSGTARATRVSKPGQVVLGRLLRTIKREEEVVPPLTEIVYEFSLRNSLGVSKR